MRNSNLKKIIGIQKHTGKVRKVIFYKNFIFLFFQVLNAIKMRVNTARKLDKLMLDDRKETVEKNWLQKAAEEADLVIIFQKNILSNL